MLKLTRKGDEWPGPVRWECGLVGLPKNPVECGAKDSMVAAKCGGCGSDGQTNMVKVLQPDGTVIPWIEPRTAPPGAAAGTTTVDNNGVASS